MFRSLHMKLVMIMLLLVTSLMAVVGAFLMTSVTNFYIDDFYEQMSEVFGESNAAFVSSLREEAAQEDGAARLQTEHRLAQPQLLCSRRPQRRSACFEQRGRPAA